MGETFTTQIQARFRDINLAGHVDNVEAVRVLDEARLEFYRFAPLPGLPEGLTGILQAADDGVTDLVATQTITYNAEMRFAPYQHFRARLWVSRIGRTSFTISGELRVEDGGSPAVLWECTTVLWDHTAGTSWPLNDAVRADLERYLGEPVGVRR
jgi:acyl-CoA thioester hydrolase